MPYFEITDSEWDSFEAKFNILRTDVVEVANIFRSPGRIFVLRTNLELWNQKKANREQFRNVPVTFYHKFEGLHWTSSTLKE